MLYKSIIQNNVTVYSIFFPTSITIKLTNSCNLNCSFCSQGDAKNVCLDVDVVKQILDEAKLYGVYEIIYTGGEPLLYSHISEVLRYGKELGFHQILVTNGVNLEHCIEEIIAYVDNIGISIHGNETVHDSIVGKVGTYRKVVSNIKRIYKAETKPYITLNFTISDNNIECIEDVIQLSNSYGCHLCVARLNKIGRAEKNEDIANTVGKFLEQLVEDNLIKVSNVIPLCQMPKKYQHLCHSCSAGIASVCVEANGDVKMCASSSKSYGSVKENSLYEIWNNLEFTKFRSLKWLPDLCKTCRYFAQCLGGCKAENNRHLFTKSKDCLVTQAVELFYEQCTQKRLVINFGEVRRVGREYLLIGRPNRIVDEEGFHILKQLMKTKKFEDYIQKLDEEKKVETVEFLYAMYRDGLLTFE